MSCSPSQDDSRYQLSYSLALSGQALAQLIDALKLTELFQEARGKNTHIIVERIVNDIDEIVKKVRFPDWQRTTQGERLVQRELRKTLLKYQLHRDQDLFDKAYAYIRQYY